MRAGATRRPPRGPRAPAAGRRLRGAGVLALLLAAACGAPEPAAGPPPAPVTPRATTVLEPPVLEIGDTAVVEIAVATPPGFEVTPPEPPEEVPGLWLLGAEVPQVARTPERHVHRTRFRVRARDTGAFVWPAQPLEVVDAAGEPVPLTAPERPFEVVSQLGEDDAPQSFLSYRTAPVEGAQTGPGAALAALAGALGALAAVGLVLLVRRVRAAERGARAGEGAPALVGLVAPWRAAHATLEAAQTQAEAEPQRAADLVASALRVLAARRLDPGLLTRTTEELAARPAPPGLESAWTELVALLRELDALRFAPGDPAPTPEDADAVRALLARGRVLADRLGPRGSAR